MELVKLPSGSIDLVETKSGTVLQFNSSCVDALPYCKGMCCGMRHMYNTKLTEAEATVFVSFGKGSGPWYIAYDQIDKKCIYQNKETGLCNVHEYKPSGCVSWHCSPGGVGEGLTVRAGGWFLLPVVLDNDGVVRMVSSE